MDLVRRSPILVAILALGSCSYSIDIVAKVVDGRLTFTTPDARFECVENIMLTAEEGPAPNPAPGDDILLVKNGAAYWWTQNPVTGCFAKFPITYGQKLGKAKAAVAPKNLLVDVIYEVTTQGGGAYGGGRFRIRIDRTIENLPPRLQIKARNSS